VWKDIQVPAFKKIWKPKWVEIKVPAWKEVQVPDWKKIWKPVRKSSILMDLYSKSNVTFITDLGALQEGSMEGRQGS